MIKKVLAGACVLASTTGLTFAQPFSFELLRSDLVPTVFGSVSWADADLDGKMDVVITGSTSHEDPYEPHTTLYLQGDVTGSGAARRQNFTARELPVGVWHSASAWDDFDRDGDPDVAVLGAAKAEQPFEGRTLVMRNDGTGNFSVVSAGLPGLYSGSVDWGDYDNDGDADLLLSGVSGDEFVTALMRNDDGSFTRVDVGLVDVGYGSARFGDYDGDRDLDVAVTGQGVDGYVTEIYRNDEGAYTAIGLDASYGLVYSSVAWGDVDDDGDLDLLLTGGQVSEFLYTGRSLLLVNLGNDLFSEQSLEEIGMLEGSASWGDINLDGRLDAIVSGAYYPSGPRATRAFFNRDGALEAAANLPGTLFGDASLGDYDADGDLDLVMTGIGALLTDVTTLYVNAQRLVNDPPAAPTQLNASVDGGRVTLTWDVALDDRSEMLTYNLRVGTTEGGLEVMSPTADTATGRRYVSGPGNVQQNNGWIFFDLPPGTYWWSVQAIDRAFSGSEFSSTQRFTVPAE